MDIFTTYGERVVKCENYSRSMLQILCERGLLASAMIASDIEGECKPVVAYAKCHNRDTFSTERGMKISSSKAQLKLHKKRLSTLIGVRRALEKELEAIDEILAKEVSQVGYQSASLEVIENY